MADAVRDLVRTLVGQLRDRLQQQEDEILRLRGALEALVPPPHGAYGGPLTCMKPVYEDGSKARLISREDVERARLALASMQEASDG